MMGFFKKYLLPTTILMGIVGILAATNYHPGTWLTGWDNLHPEFNLFLNIKRSIFAVWQEYQGTGLLGGMGHASDLIRQLFLLLLSTVFPDAALRYIYTFLMLIVGSTGAFTLIHFVVRQLDFPHLKKPMFWVRQDKGTIMWMLDRYQWAALLGALFYLLNLATIQTFYVPFEAFISHYGFLPWFLYASVKYVLYPKWRNLALLIFVLIMNTPSAYIPTLFVVEIIALGTFLGVLLPFYFNRSVITQLVKLGLLIFLINAFWLAPFAYFTVTKAHINIDSKINQMATEDIFLRNKEFGNLKDVALLRGFWLNNVDPNLEGRFVYMMSDWRNHLQNPVSIVFGFLLFGVVIIGAGAAIRKRTPLAYAAVALLFVCLTAMATDTAPFQQINTLIRNNIQILNQAFRFPFTKFSILTSLSYAILFGIGAQAITSYIHPTIRKFAYSGVFYLLLIPLVYLTAPAFTGKLFYEKETIQIPKEYFELFKFFDKQDHNTRIANFPQHTFWGWNFYTWGYGGSGFPWYGIPQPMLDRAFDVWSSDLENYYYEISYGLYSKNPTIFINTINKYQIDWIVIDRNVHNPFSYRALFNSELETIIKHNSSIKRAATFGNITVYKVDLENKPNQFVFATNPLPTVNAYNWNDHDQAYADLATYSSIGTEPSDYYYPLRSLFSLKSQKEKEYVVKEAASTIVFEQPIESQLAKKQITIPAFSEKQSTIPVSLYLHKQTADTMVVTATIQTPQIYLNNQRLWGKQQEYTLFRINTADAKDLHITVNGAINIPLASRNNRDEFVVKEGILVTTFLSLTNDNDIFLSDNTNEVVSAIGIPTTFFEPLDVEESESVTLPEFDGAALLSVRVPKLDDNYASFLPDVTAQNRKPQNCDRFREGSVGTTIVDANAERVDVARSTASNGEDIVLSMSTKNATHCLGFYSATLPHEEGYVMFVTAKNMAGRGLHSWILNQDEQYAPLDSYLPIQNEFTTSTFILPPMDRYGKSYSFHFDNISIGSDVTTNELKKVSIHQIPYNFLQSLVISTDEAVRAKSTRSDVVQWVTHPNESLYRVGINTAARSPYTVVLSQAYDTGWKAYALPHVQSSLQRFMQDSLPMVFGQEIPTQTKVNNWQNGWVVDGLPEGHSDMVIVFTPQYLEYAGFGAFVLGLIPILFYRKKRRKKYE